MKARKVLSWGQNLSILAVSAALLIAAVPARAQVDAGSILGTISDQTGAVIAGASVTLTNEGTSASLTTESGPDGSYKFAPVKIGSYKLDITIKGFEPVTAKGIIVNIGVNVVQELHPEARQRHPIDRGYSSRTSA